MKMIKKYWAIIIGSVLAFFGIAVAVKKKVDDKQNAKAAKKIDDNEQHVDVITGKIDAIEDQKTQVKKDIVELVADVKKLEDKKQNNNTTKIQTPKQTKQNILNKTSKKRKK
jgi:hypothetical protein